MEHLDTLRAKPAGSAAVHPQAGQGSLGIGFHLAGRLCAAAACYASDQEYFLTAFSMAPPALARSSGTMTG